MREIRNSGSVERVMGNDDSYSDFFSYSQLPVKPIDPTLSKTKHLTSDKVRILSADANVRHVRHQL
jgi:hypothetical protein